MIQKTIAARLAAAFGAVALSTAPGVSQAFPDKPVRLLVGFAAGGSTDVVARLLAPRMEAALGQPVVVENRTGAGGAIAANEVAKAAPDGHTTFLCSTGVFSIQPFLPQPGGFDPAQSTPVSLVAMTPYLVLVNKDSPAKSLPALLDYAGKNPGKLNYASSGNGTASHLAGAMMQQRTGLDIQHVPYKGAGQAMTDLIAGRVSIMFDQVVSAMPQLQAGGVRALAVVNDQRLASMPDLPTVAEAGLKDFDPTPWVGLCTSPGVPAERVEILQKAVLKALADPEIQKRFVADGLPIVGSTSQEFAAFLARDREKWGGAVKQIKFD